MHKQFSFTLATISEENHVQSATNLQPFTCLPYFNYSSMMLLSVWNVSSRMFDLFNNKKKNLVL
jgi:hypothetical protein